MSLLRCFELGVEQGFHTIGEALLYIEINKGGLLCNCENINEEMVKFLDDYCAFTKKFNLDDSTSIVDAMKLLKTTM